MSNFMEISSAFNTGLREFAAQGQNPVFRKHGSETAVCALGLVLASPIGIVSNLVIGIFAALPATCHQKSRAHFTSACKDLATHTWRLIKAAILLPFALTALIVNLAVKLPVVLLASLFAIDCGAKKRPARESYERYSQHQRVEPYIGGLETGSAAFEGQQQQPSYAGLSSSSPVC